MTYNVFSGTLNPTHFTSRGHVLKATQQGAAQYGADADWGVLNGVHIGATWRIQLNRPCAAAMQP